MAYTTINKPTDYFNTKLYTGDGTSSNAITGVGFQPDLTWIKARSDTTWHHLFDAVRGANKALNSNVTNAEGTVATFPSFDSDGFTVNGANAGNLNTSSQTNASWNWLANGAGSANTDGSINTTVSANTTSGFSIGTYNGSGSDNTVGHGLGVAPDMIIVKCKSTAHDWVVYHSALGNTKILTLNATTAAQSAGGWQNTSPTSTVFSIDNAANSLNQSGQSFVFYAFAEKQGYSKFGSYTGNGSASSGTFIYTGFKPAFVMIKSSSSAQSWSILDIKRDVNPNAKVLWPNDNYAEYDETQGVDFLSNGFKNNESGAGFNGSGASYIYMAFAEQPLVGSNNVPCTAR